MPTSSPSVLTDSRSRWVADERSRADRRALLDSLAGSRPSSQQAAVFPGRPWLIPKNPSPGVQAVERAPYRTELVAPRSVNQHSPSRRSPPPPSSPFDAYQLAPIAPRLGFIPPVQTARPAMSGSRGGSGESLIKRKPVPEFDEAEEARGGAEVLRKPGAQVGVVGGAENGVRRAASSAGVLGGEGTQLRSEVGPGAQEEELHGITFDAPSTFSTGELEATDGGRSWDDDDHLPIPGSLDFFHNPRRPSLPIIEYLAPSTTSFPRRPSLPIGLVPSSPAAPLLSPAFSNTSSDPSAPTASHHSHSHSATSLSSAHATDEEGDDEVEEPSMDEAALVVERTSARLRREKRERNERRRAAKADKERRRADRLRRAEEEKRAELEALEEEDRRVAQEIRERTRAKSGRRGSAKSVESTLEVDPGAAVVSLAAGWRASMIEDAETPERPRSVFMEKFSSDSSARDSSDQEAVTAAESTSNLSSPSTPTFSTPIASPAISPTPSLKRPFRSLSLLRRKSVSKEPPLDVRSVAAAPPQIPITCEVDTSPIFDEQIWTKLLNVELARDGDDLDPKRAEGNVLFLTSTLATSSSSNTSSPEFTHDFPSPPRRSDGVTPTPHDLPAFSPSIPARLASTAGSLFRWGSTSRQVNDSIAPHDVGPPSSSEDIGPVLDAHLPGVVEQSRDGVAGSVANVGDVLQDEQDEDELEDELRRSSISTRSSRRRGEDSPDFARAETVAVETVKNANTVDDPQHELATSSSSSSGPPTPPQTSSLPSLFVDSTTHRPSLQRNTSSSPAHSPLELRSSTQAHEVYDFLLHEEPPAPKVATPFSLVSTDTGFTPPTDPLWDSTPATRHSSLPPTSRADRVPKKRHSSISLPAFLHFSKSTSPHAPLPIPEVRELSSASPSLKTSTIEDDFGPASRTSKQKPKGRSNGTLRRINSALGSMMAFSDRLTGMKEHGEGKSKESPVFVARGSITNEEILRMRQEGQYWDPSSGEAGAFVRR